MKVAIESSSIALTGEPLSVKLYELAPTDDMIRSKLVAPILLAVKKGIEGAVWRLLVPEKLAIAART
jgi:hypothetical protein